MRKKLFRKKSDDIIIKPPSLDSFPDFTKKEIFTQGELISELVERYIKADKIDFDYLKIKADKIKRIYAVGSGVNYACALFCAYNMEVLADVISVAVSNSEFLCSNPILDKNTLVIMIGDDKKVENRAHTNGAMTVKIVGYSDDKNAVRLNFKTLGSFESAEFTLKLSALSLFALYLGEKKQVVTSLYIKIATQMIKDLPQKIKHILSQEFLINEICKSLNFEKMLITGTNVDYSIAIYSALLLSDTANADISAVSLGELTPYQKSSKMLLALASNIDFYNLLDTRLTYQLKILSASVDALDEKTLLYDESIPLLNPILSAVVIQMTTYKKSTVPINFINKTTFC